MDRKALADFLRRRREALSPESAGLAPTRRRRTPGLRREEVAALAHMSVGFYERLEQARGSAPSRETVTALSRALRLTSTERSHLFELAGHVAPPSTYRADHPSPELTRVLDHLDTPAQIVTDLGVTLRQNPFAEALLGDQTHYVGPSRSMIYRWFTDPQQRRIYAEEDHPSHARNHVASLRTVCGRGAPDGEAEELVDRLRQESEEFPHLWQLHEVATRPDAPKRYVHPLVGPLTLDCQVLTADNPVERLVIFTARPGSMDADRLKLISVVASQGFEHRHSGS